MKIDTRNKIKNVLRELAGETATEELSIEIDKRAKRILSSENYEYKFISIDWEFNRETRYVQMPSIKIYLLSGEKIKISLSVDEYISSCQENIMRRK